MFTTLDKTLTDLAARRKKLEKIVSDKTAEERELLALRQQEADLLAQRQRAADEIAQLTAERADLARDVALFDTLLKDKDAGLRFLQRLVDVCERGYLGAAQSVASAYEMGQRAADFAVTLRARLATIDARLKELDQ